MKPRTPLTPRDFLKSRRPERFSDSIHLDEPVLDRSHLEYHLSTLTNRGQEKDFEQFARHLAQREICPNLLPQTGPTGGGDSKVDSETYPVSDTLALTWYVSDSQRAANDRWAFAFSAKADWRSKVKSDVQKIADTARGYSKAFFVTNQFVPDKSRAEIEDSLTKTHKIEVRIFDRTWILDKVFENRHEALAITDLRIQTTARSIIRKGPKDVERELYLEKIEERLAKASQESLIDINFVNDCLAAAEIARDMERPRSEVDGRFDRARRAAEKHGTTHQQLVCAYSEAWTSYWWHEDLGTFVSLYLKVESLANGSTNAYELELLSNLWTILNAQVRSQRLDDRTVSIELRTDLLMNSLKQMAGESSRPSTALKAKSIILLMELLLNRGKPHDTSNTLAELEKIVRDSRRLVGFHLEQLVNVLLELGSYLGDQTGYDKLLETIIEVTSVRTGELKAARILTCRGEQFLNADRPTEAIRTLGRSLSRLYKYESREDLIRALYACSIAYERIGLLWAARGTILNAASIATNEFWSKEQITRQQAVCFNRLKWLELQLKRIPQSLAWHQIDLTVRLAIDEHQIPLNDEYIQSETTFDGILGILLLRTDIWDLRKLIRLPNALDSINLTNSSIALRYALGHESSVDEELCERTTNSLDEFFRIWRDQPASSQIRGKPEFYDSHTVMLTSKVLGCNIKVDVDNDISCIILAESILAAVESLMATGFVDQMMVHEPLITISIRNTGYGEIPFRVLSNNDLGRPHFDIKCCNLKWFDMDSDTQQIVRDKLIELIAAALSRLLFNYDDDKLMKLFKDDRVLERSIDFTMGFVSTSNTLGHNPRFNISQWADNEATEYPLTRTVPWDSNLPLPNPVDAEVANELKPEKSLREQINNGQIKHTQIEIVTLIRDHLWNQAKWVGTGFIWSDSKDAPPLLAPIFEKKLPAVEIFGYWKQELGSQDVKERLRITVIRGVKRNEPFTYRVIFNINPDVQVQGKSNSLTTTLARVNTMEAKSHANLNHFLDNFQRSKQFTLTFGIISNDSQQPELMTQFAITKNELIIRDAWQIGPDDIDIAGLTEEDDPIIPSDQSDPPVLKVQHLRKGKS